MKAEEFVVVLVGRPNVGKSSLFNALLGYRRAIVFDQPGTTLDEVRERVEWNGNYLQMVDSQGLYGDDFATLQTLLKKADAAIFVVDAVAGPTPYDELLAKELHLWKGPVLVCVNKSEGHNANVESSFAPYGFDEIIPVSAAHKTNLNIVRAWGADLRAAEGTKQNSTSMLMSLALVGRPNTGKSTLMNSLCDEEVSRVSPLPLTTRDPVSYEIPTKEGIIKIIDTAGMRRPRSKKDEIETFSVQATTRTIRTAEVIFLLIACHEPVSDQDVRLLSLLRKEGKPAAVLLNFWDRLTPKERKTFLDDSEFAPFLKEFKCIPISGLTRYNLKELVPTALRLFGQARKRVKTSRLNQIVDVMIKKNPPPSNGKGNFNILYASQVKVEPPTFVFFMNRKGAITPSYQKYLTNELRTRLGFKGQAIRVMFRGGETRQRYQ